MYFFDFLSQYKRFLDGKVSAPDFAHWLFAHNDEMEDSLIDSAWDAFLVAQHLAAEFTGDFIPESLFRDRLREAWSSSIFSLASSNFFVFNPGNSKLIRMSLQPPLATSGLSDASPFPSGSNSSPQGARTVSGDSFRSPLRTLTLQTL